MSLLKIEEVRGGYGKADILNGCSLEVAHGEIAVIIGPNGAGKSTLMKAVFGLAHIHKGGIFFNGEDITNLATQKVVAHGLAYVPQENNVFPTMTVEENLEMGAFLRDDDFREQMERVFELFPRLKERRAQPAGTMSGGERQMLAMGRAMMMEPRMLLLDEPTAGLSPKYIDQTFELVKTVNDLLGVTILMVEQNARQALEIADKGHVLVMGRNRHDGTGRELLDDPDVARMFLGG
ncbi:MAG: ABC transporter ATP-binding protein [Alphaproteobacteria bacterium]|nr:ABC transporter ATP-binding protein [Alphaproteobacteria bacterium]